ncbi:hypothetical protein TeGR_g11131 [Tetraparma gracilis]|uniref:Ubiquitin carboxyl-terminal hydrolase n=1 Tax=Tetraparma gracilis TaxID=2962635 RepID=A0ABQ6MHV5_9STRA|nr:hypothetical protein TeGR_g11131 [Tetraparma gracilis]
MPERRWKPLESNPEAIQSYARSLGLSDGYTFADVVACEEWALDMLPGPAKAFVFLYPITEIQETYHKENLSPPHPAGASLVGIKQNIGNACGTIALLHSVANLLPADPSILAAGDSFLRDFCEKGGATPDERAAFLEGSDDLEKKHASAASSAENSTDTPDQEDKVNDHFVAFAEVSGGVYELDGRREGGKGTYHGEAGDNWRMKALGLMQEYMARDPSQHKFNIIAVCGPA